MNSKFNPFHFHLLPDFSKAEETLRHYFPFVERFIDGKNCCYDARLSYIKKEPKEAIILGGGPSLKDCSLDFSKRPVVFSMNKFNEGFNLDLLTLSGGCKGIYDTQRGLYVGLELHDAWLENGALLFLPQHKLTPYQTRFFGKLGVGARQLILAAELGFKEISFVGFDGPQAILKGDHAFEPGKTELPQFINAKNAMPVFQFQYNLLYNMLKEDYPDTRFYSIQRDNPLHKLAYKYWG